MVISSLENQRVKNWVRLQQKKYRDLTSSYLVEGYHLLEEAIKANVILEIILLEGEEEISGFSCTYVTGDVMKKITSLESTVKVVAVCKKQEFSSIFGNKLLLLDEIQDPGNLGTIIRSSVAFGVDMILLSENTVDLYNPKVLRSTQGMHFHIPILSVNSFDALTFLKENEYTILGTNVVNGVDARKIDQSSLNKFCLVMGNEGNGIRPSISDLCDKNLYIPISDKVESLNVGVACSILLYELER